MKLARLLQASPAGLPCIPCLWGMKSYHQVMDQGASMRLCPLWNVAQTGKPPSLFPADVWELTQQTPPLLLTLGVARFWAGQGSQLSGARDPPGSCTAPGEPRGFPRHPFQDREHRECQQLPWEHQTGRLCQASFTQAHFSPRDGCLTQTALPYASRHRHPSIRDPQTET